MARRLSPAIIVVVHGRKVIMNERIIMDKLQSAGKGKKDIPADPKTGSRRKEEKRPESFPPRENSISHGPIKKRIFLRQKAPQFPLDEIFFGFEALCDAHGLKGSFLFILLFFFFLLFFLLFFRR
jgi:hypothetical protein